MFVKSSDAEEAMEILNVLRDNLAVKVKLSAFDSQLLQSLDDAINALTPKPYKQYDTIQTAVGNYVELRDMLGIERKSWETFEGETKNEMERISMFLRDKGDELGVDSFATPYGTAYRNTKTSYRIEQDGWEKFSKWMAETDNLQCVEKRPAKLSVKEILDTTGELPPGLYQEVEVEFNVRRPTKGKGQ